jgi:hypothetical protein
LVGRVWILQVYLSDDSPCLFGCVAGRDGLGWVMKG